MVLLKLIDHESFLIHDTIRKPISLCRIVLLDEDL
jgi:hypothetical protein